MANAREEFLKHIDGKEPVLCAVIRDYDTEWGEENGKTISLPMNYNRHQYETFLSQLDFEYCEGFGGQELFGNIWYEDGTWSSRGEYDGSEWWDYNSCPEIPVECK